MIQHGTTGTSICGSCGIGHRGGSARDRDCYAIAAYFSFQTPRRHSAERPRSRGLFGRVHCTAGTAGQENPCAEPRWHWQHAASQPRTQVPECQWHAVAPSAAGHWQGAVCCAMPRLAAGHIHAHACAEARLAPLCMLCHAQCQGLYTVHCFTGCNLLPRPLCHV